MWDKIIKKNKNSSKWWNEEIKRKIKEKAKVWKKYITVNSVHREER